jgi:hypothetical protein
MLVAALTGVSILTSWGFRIDIFAARIEGGHGCDQPKSDEFGSRVQSDPGFIRCFPKASDHIHNKHT